MEQALIEKFVDLQEEEVLKTVRQMIEGDADPQNILNACQKAMVMIGEKFEEGVYFVSDLMMAGNIFKQVSEIVRPISQTGSTTSLLDKVVIGTVAGDIHDIGKNLVVGLLEANNYEVYDLGIDQKNEIFIDKVKETGASVLALSGLLTVAFDSMKETIALLEEEGLRDKVKVMIGGGTIDQGVCKITGADGWGANAQVAVNLCREWIGG